MARKKNPETSETGDAGLDDTTDTSTEAELELDPSAPSRVARPLEVNGVAVPTHRFPAIAQIDPASLKGPAGEDPILALPAAGGKVVFRAILASHAAELLACDESGGASRYRLATNEEAEAFLTGKA